VVVSDIAIFVLKRDVKLQLTNSRAGGHGPRTRPVDTCSVYGVLPALRKVDRVLAVAVCLSVCLSVTSRCSTETAKRRIPQQPHDSPGTLVFCCRKSRQNSNAVTPNEGAKCRLGRLNAGAVAANWRLLTRSVVNLVRSQVERSPYLFAARSP